MTFPSRTNSHTPPNLYKSISSRTIVNSYTIGRRIVERDPNPMMVCKWKASPSWYENIVLDPTSQQIDLAACVAQRLFFCHRCARSRNLVPIQSRLVLRSHSCLFLQSYRGFLNQSKPWPTQSSRFKVRDSRSREE